MSWGFKSGAQPTVMSHDFSQIPKAEIPRASFDRSHGWKGTFNAADLVPVYVDEALPGDTFNLKMSTFARLATPIVPVMDNMYCDSFFFAVPYRLVWGNWQRFNGEQDSPSDSTDYVIPQQVSPVSTGYATNSLQDYMGLPPLVAGISHSALWLRAYNLIYNEWFRDQNLIDGVVVDTDDGPDTVSDYVLLQRGKRHDYFTSCLPWPQKGPAVPLPLGTSAPVTGIGVANQTYPDGPVSVYQTPDPSGSISYTYAKLVGPVGADQQLYVQGDQESSGDLQIYADLSQATASTINALRQAFQLQKLYERDARGGTRYTEIIRSHFGVSSPDARLQRPEYLGGGSTPITFSPIPQTSETATTPQGNLSAIGTHSQQGQGFTKSFTEHCLLIGLVSVRMDINYQSGLNRMWSRSSRFDFYWPALSHIGEQAVLNQEIYAQGSADPTADAAVFGYQERYAEYRYKPSLITGQFRSQASSPLDIWHLAEKFTALPTLGETFITVNDAPVNRIIAVTDSVQFLCDAYFKLTCARPMPAYSVPGLIDHF